jgi:hypothetical protein
LNTVRPPQHIFAEYAATVAATGYRVFPTHNKKPAIKDFTGAKTQPYYRQATTDLRQIARWAKKFGDCNIGIAPDYNRAVLDVENDHALSVLAANARCTPAELIAYTKCNRTGGGGYHLYFDLEPLWAHFDRYVVYYNKRLKFDGELLPIDLKTMGGFVLAPPSVSHKGVYSVLTDKPAAPMPTAIHFFLARCEMVRVGPGRTAPEWTPPAIITTGWDQSEYEDDTDDCVDDNNTPGLYKRQQSTPITRIASAASPGGCVDDSGEEDDGEDLNKR